MLSCRQLEAVLRDWHESNNLSDLIGELELPG